MPMFTLNIELDQVYIGNAISSLDDAAIEDLGLETALAEEVLTTISGGSYGEFAETVLGKRLKEAMVEFITSKVKIVQHIKYRAELVDTLKNARD